MADTDPLEYKQRSHVDLDVVSHGLTLWDLDREFATGGFGGKPFKKLRDILGVLRDAYCRTIGIEYMHMQDPEQRAWIQARIERRYDKPPREEQLRILRRLNAAEAFETFLQTKYVGQKRFSLEGAESVIPLMDAVLSAAAEDGLDEVCIGMPHRGRLNVLANIAGKSYGQIFREFEGDFEVEGSVQGSGDVKYHLGTSGTFTTESGEQIPVYLAANPSHLEAVNPVLEGIVRAKQDLLPRGRIFSVLPRPAARRRGLRGPGRGGRDAEPVAAARLPHRRHHAHRREQPGRLHDRAGGVTVVGLRHRRGPHGAGTDLPRERRRPRGRASASRGSRSSSARSSTRTSSSTWSATAGAVTTRPTTRR